MVKKRGKSVAALYSIYLYLVCVEGASVVLCSLVELSTTAARALPAAKNVFLKLLVNCSLDKEFQTGGGSGFQLAAVTVHPLI